MIRNIIFDMGNTVIRFDPRYFIDRAGINDAEDRRIILNELFLSIEWAQMDAGTLTEETAEPLILPRFPERLHDTVKELLYRWAYSRDMIPGMEELIRRLKEQDLLADEASEGGVELLSSGGDAAVETMRRLLEMPG